MREPETPIADRTRHDRGHLLSILALGVFLSVCLPHTALGADRAAAPFEFEQYEVVTGSAKRQTVLTGFLLGGAMANLAVVNIDEDNSRRLRIYAFGDGTWAPKHDVALRPDVLFVDVADIGGRDRLLTYESGRLNWFDPDLATERALMSVTTSFNATNAGVIPQVDITRDLNRDGHDDLLVPDVDGFWISIQESDGSFSDPMKLGPPEPFVDEVGLDDSGANDSLTYGEVGITTFTAPLYSSRVHEMDYNQDGRNDLVFWNADHFEVHYQTEGGPFSPNAETFTTEVPFDADGVYSHAFQFSDAGVFAILFGLGKNVERTVLHSLRDMNGDDVTDLVTLTLSGRSPFRLRSVYEVHFGTSTPDGIVFSTEVSTAIHPRGKAGGAQPWGYSSRSFEDFDGDGHVEIMLRDVTIGLGGMIRALAANSVGIDLEFFRMAGGVYPDKANFTRKIRPAVELFGERGPFLPGVLLGDVNGDGRADLLAGGKTRQGLDVFFGVPGPDMFAPRPRKVAVEMPVDAERSWLVDLNLDGKQDILVHDGPTHRAPTKPHRLTTLIAQ